MINYLERKWIALILTVLISIEIFYFSSIPGTVGVGGNPWPARTYHFAAFFLFTFFFMALIKRKQKIKLKHILIVATISILHAFLDEYHQTFVLLRDSNITDILTDTIGIFTSISIYFFIDKNQ
jgi:VanZ family protein